MEVLGRLGIDTALAMAEGSERGKEEGGMEDGQAGACDANHPTAIRERAYHMW